MTKERTYSATNKCLYRIKTSNLDQMLKVRLECHFIRLKRHILSSPDPVRMDDISALEALSEEVVDSDQKEKAIARLEKKIQQILQSVESFH